MAENAIKRVRDNCKPSLLMHKINAALNTQMGGNTFLDEEREHMAFFGADLLTHNKIKTISTPCPQVTSAQRALNYVMIGNSNHI